MATYLTNGNGIRGRGRWGFGQRGLEISGTKHLAKREGLKV